MTPTDKTEELMPLVDKAACAHAKLRLEATYGTSASYTAQCRAEAAEARSTLRAAIEKALSDAMANAHAEGMGDDLAELERYRAATPGWLPIEQAPKDCRTMFVVRGFNVTNENCHVRNYTTDAYCVWPSKAGGWVRWPHKFPPTHYMPLPAPPDKTAAPAHPAAEPAYPIGGIIGSAHGVVGWGVGKQVADEMNGPPAAKPAGTILTVEAVFPHFSTAHAYDQAGERYVINLGTAGIDFASLKPDLRLVARVNERNYVVSATLEGE